jgi:hypothetical protein
VQDGSPHLTEKAARKKLAAGKQGLEKKPETRSF